MNQSEVDYLMETLETGHQFYNYYKDKYALDLLAYFVQKEVSVAELKKSRLGFLLQKPRVQDVLAKIGKNKVRSEYFETVYDVHTIGFTYTLGIWGEYQKYGKDDWYQTSRSGKNLVLQLNFDKSHVNEYFRVLKPNKHCHPFVFKSHPVLTGRGFTMAWARLDIDLDEGEVLIEEVQNDWLREAKDESDWARRELKKMDQNKKNSVDRPWVNELLSYIRYYEEYLKGYTLLWEEAILNLAIYVAKKELACNRIYYNTFETGNRLKGLCEGSRPPRSLYTKLPRKFGFDLTAEAPKMLKKERRLKKKLKDKALQWYVLGA